jgi:transcriptional regulator with XRE-family HTH domain
MREGSKPCLDRILNELMERHKISISRLARETGVPKSSLFEWTTGRAPRNLGDIRRIAGYFRVSLHFLIFGEQDPYAHLPSVVSVQELPEAAVS